MKKILLSFIVLFSLNLSAAEEEPNLGKLRYMTEYSRFSINRIGFECLSCKTDQGCAGLLSNCTYGVCVPITETCNQKEPSAFEKVKALLDGKIAVDDIVLGGFMDGVCRRLCSDRGGVRTSDPCVCNNGFGDGETFPGRKNKLQ